MIDNGKNIFWQLRRLQILHRDGFKCVECGSQNVSLHVHHKKYDDNLKYWEYPDKYLVTVCKYCHEKIHQKTILKDFYVKNGSIKPFKFSPKLLKEFGIVVVDKKKGRKPKTKNFDGTNFIVANPKLN